MATGVLRGIVERAWARPVPEGVARLAEAAIDAVGPSAVVAVLFYGSCYRTGEVAEGMVDLYLLVDDYASMRATRFARFANRLVPPNVYYLQVEHAGVRLRAKYAVVAFDAFERLVAPSTRNPYFWARFAQPTGVVRVDDAYRERLIRGFGNAIIALYTHARALAQASAPTETREPGNLWVNVLQATYRTELRAEKPFRAEEIYSSDRERFDEIDRLLRREDLPPPNGASWRLRRIEGKALSVLRLLKAAFTFVGGADYLV